MTDSSVSARPHRLPFRRRCAVMAAALGIPFLCDRLILDGPFTHESWPLWPLWAAWCLAIALIGMALYAREARRTPLWWIVGGAIAIECGWLIVANPRLGAVDGLRSNGAGVMNLWYALMTALIVLPALLMTLLQLSDGRFDARRPGRLVVHWLRGWMIDPFTGWDALGQTFGDLWHRLVGDRPSDEAAASGEAPRMRRRIGLALAICVPLLMALVPLLMTADEVFDYGITHLVGSLDVASLLLHAALTLTPFPFVFSLIVGVEHRASADAAADANANANAGTTADADAARRPFDPLVASIVLGVVLALYAAFCAVQIMFLFAGAALPSGTTYAAYARSGFFQLLVVAALNLAGFGLVLRFAPRTRILTGMQIGLIAATAVMLASAALRLGLYIDAYGLTWLRYLSITFIALLAALLALALARLLSDRLPLMTVGFVLALVWWIAIGCANPTGVATWWNATHGML